MLSVLGESSSSLKIPKVLREAIGEPNSNDTLLIWLDVYIPPCLDGNVYLSSKDYSPITNIGAKIAGVTFSPDKATAR